jgi:ABC-type multidrug transport system ATPase subunit
MSTPAVAVSHLSKYFPQIELRHLLRGRRMPGVWALKDAAFELQAGEGLCLVGPNGSGKTTLVKLIATLLEPTQGQIFIQGHDLQSQQLQAKRHLGFITCNEESFYGRLSGWQNLAFFARLQNLDPEAAIPPVAKSLRLEPYLDNRFFSYSTGVKRRFDLARGLLHQPDILLLDEPTTNLDPISAAEVRELLVQFKNRGKTLITVTHNLEEVRKLGQRLAIMREGVFQEVNLAPEEDLEELYRRVVLGGGSAE